MPDDHLWQEASADQAVLHCRSVEAGARLAVAVIDSFEDQPAGWLKVQRGRPPRQGGENHDRPGRRYWKLGGNRTEQRSA
jgi:hypothetical protein